MDSVLIKDNASTVHLHRIIANHALQYSVLIVSLGFLETIKKTLAQNVIQKLNIAPIAMMLIPVMAVTNQLQIRIQKEHVQTVILKMVGTRTLKPDSVNVLIMSMSKVEISVKPVIN